MINNLAIYVIIGESLEYLVVIFVAYFFLLKLIPFVAVVAVVVVVNFNLYYRQRTIVVIINVTKK